MVGCTSKYGVRESKIFLLIYIVMKRLTNEEFIEKSIKIHGDIYDYSLVDYINNSTDVSIICKKCGNIFSQKPIKHLVGHGCRFCKRKELANSQKMPCSEFISRAQKIHGDKYDYSKVKYINNSTKVCIICKKHNHEFFQTPNNHLSGQGCYLCGREKVSRLYSKNTYLFIEKAKSIHGDTYGYSRVKYINSWTKVIIICKKHGEFEQEPNSHLSGHGCPICKSSKGELKIEEYLKNNEIEYKRQHKIKLERYMFSRNSLKVDFFLPQHNTFIEFNGIQHYEFNPYFHKSEDDFKVQVERDKRLKDYCKKNKIKLITIKYNQIGKIGKILKHNIVK